MFSLSVLDVPILRNLTVGEVTVVLADVLLRIELLFFSLVSEILG